MMVVSKKFEELYRQLNSEQKEAVDWIEGPVMVVAGPGTGKTQILTLRIANILLKTQINPGNILALTFTESGAAAMRQRLTAIMGQAAYQVNIFTFHGFCYDLIRSYPEEFSAILGRQPASEVDQIVVMKKAIDKVNLQWLRPFGEPYFYLAETRRLISQLKREGVEPEKLAAVLKKERENFEAIADLYYASGRYQGKMKGKYAEQQKQLEKNEELVKIYRAYQQALTEQKRYDYDDLILETLKVLEQNEDFLRRLQERFHYFLVDEHQDTNNAQNKVLELLSNFFTNPNLFVVGDEKQAIFRFQGASLENFLYFQKLYPRAKLITLRRNYRSGQLLLDAAHSLIVHRRQNLAAILGHFQEDLTAAASRLDHFLEVYEFSRPEEENYFLAQKILALQKEGVPLAEIAVIFRDNREAGEIGAMLEKHGLPFRLERGEDILADPEIGKLLKILRFLADWSSEEKLFEILMIDWFGLSSLDIYKLSLPGRQRTLSLLERLADTGKLKKLRLTAPEKAQKVAKQLLAWRRQMQNSSLLSLFETVVRESGLLDYLLNLRHSALFLERLEALWREVKKMLAAHPQSTLTDFIRYLDTLEEHRVTVRSRPLDYLPAAVRLLTAHGAKGLEFDYVFIVGAYDGHWGNRRIPQLLKPPKLLESAPLSENLSVERQAEKNEEERRLFYVALTRARKAAFISYARSNWEEKTQFPSQFVEEIKPELKRQGDARGYEQSLAQERQTLFRPATGGNFSVADREYLNALFLKRGFSATALNNYLACPWKFFFLNLLKIPRAKTKQQMYGTAIHAALKDLFSRLNQRPVAAEEVLASFRAALEKEPLTAADWAETQTRGEKVLRAYFNRYQPEWSGQRTLNEFRVRGVSLEISLEKISPAHLNLVKAEIKELPLTGSLDKIEFLPGGQEVKVVDYKTGRIRSRNELEGKTKNATGDYWRQLVFYKLLLDSLPSFLVKMTKGEIDFVEPDAKGIFQRESFEISAQVVQALKEQVQTIAEEIWHLRFWGRKCSDRDCQFCRLRLNLF